MNDRRGCRSRVAWWVLPVGLLLGEARGQEAAADPVADAIVARLRRSCETLAELRGAYVRGAVVQKGEVQLLGLVESREQSRRLASEADRLIDDEPAWKAHAGAGVVTETMAVFPVRSEFLPKLRRALASTPVDAKGGFPPARHVRVDDLYINARGSLQIVGLCVNPELHADHRAADAARAGDPRTKVGLVVRDALATFPLPPGVDGKVFDRRTATTVDFKENPSRPLQRLAADTPGLADVLFRDAGFDALGNLVLTGLLNAEAQRTAAEALFTRPEIAAPYARPGGAPASEPGVATAGMAVVPWAARLRDGVRDRFSRGDPLPLLRSCRVDGARFVYGPRGNLQLWCDGVAVAGPQSDVNARIAPVLREEAVRLLPQPQPSFSVVANLRAMPGLGDELQDRVSAEPALDGVRVDDLTFGPRGEPVLGGVWVGPAQTEAVAAVVTTLLAEKAGTPVTGGVACRLAELPTRRLLEDLRARVGASFDETSLDRLSFQRPGPRKAPARPAAAPPPDAGPAPGPRRKPVLVLSAATVGPLREPASEAITGWLRNDAGAKAVGPVTLALSAEPRSLLAELRRLAATDPRLEGVRVDRAAFDVKNTLILSGYQDHEGQAGVLAEAARAAAAEVWPGRPLHAGIQAGAFPVAPLRPLLARLARVLPAYPEADGVLLTGVSYGVDSSLRFSGRATADDPNRTRLKAVIRSALGLDPRTVVGLDLTPQHRDPDRVARLVIAGVQALAAGGLAGHNVEDLDRAVFLDPGDTTTWYLRGAYYFLRGDREQATRDLRRVRQIEWRQPARYGERLRSLTRVQTETRIQLDAFLTAIEVSP